MKILLVEDDSSLREIIRITLEKERYVIEEAANYQTALSKIEDSQIPLASIGVDPGVAFGNRAIVEGVKDRVTVGIRRDEMQRDFITAGLVCRESYDPVRRTPGGRLILAVRCRIVHPDGFAAGCAGFADDNTFAGFAPAGLCFDPAGHDCGRKKQGRTP